MAGNDLTKTLEVYFDQTVQGFDPSVVLAQQANQYSPKAVDMSRANNQFWRPQPVMLQMEDGWDTTGKNPQQLQKLNVPASINKSGNIEIALNLQEMQDPTNMQAATEAAQLQIASTIDLSVADTVAKSGSLVVTGAGAMNWKLANTAGTIMNEQGVGLGAERSFFFSPQHYNDLTDILGAKGSHSGDVKTAWDEARLPTNVAGFKTFQTDYSGFVAGSAANAITLAADVSYTPAAMKSATMGDGEVPVDNRSATMSVTVASGDPLKAGDAFTIAGVYAVHHIKKNVTKRLKTFRVIDVNGTTVEYSPPLISTGPYQNVSAKGASGAAITVLNTVDESPSIFWRKNSIEIVKGNFDGLQGMAGGARFMKATTKKLGFPIAMLYWLDGKGVVYSVKWLVFFGVNNLNSEMNGVVLPNQTKATQAVQAIQQPAPAGEGGSGEVKKEK
ncbi:P22 phage major capsid protein family protein [Lelliottia wanjuensis]|uniref:P22 phage major capsid protein family protein n=1 Tax=Lelliottia wanjuensis TaxID=3050585 RepID=A0AAP4FTQ2_9ENTR|nr:MULTISPECIES: P22 phage major capsid protein family protein [unclassified Lelliottia]MDK9364176.1 P22 phage major capsid protein family protein [Lelliottia sp. V106_12]MDK9617147.1 P22 phage major capsid protein family protein [Lelliottia sp. V106_9]